MKDILSLIGNTPIITLPLRSPVPLYGKLEYFNPGGSVKDRTALHLITDAEQRGLLKAGSTIVDASSGNQGIAMAMIGRLKGYHVVITVSEKISKEKLAALQAYGAEVVVCPATSFLDHPDSYHSQAKKIASERPGAYMPNQYYNPENAVAHYRSLGPELWQQTGGSITHFFAAAGTGGTVSGAGRYLKEQNPAIKVIAVDSAHSLRATNGNPKPYRIEGMGIDFVSDVIDYSVIDEVLTVHDDPALDLLKMLAHEHGLLLGPSSGAVAWVMQEYAQKHLNRGDVAVMICGDSGRAYLSKGFYAQDCAPLIHQKEHHISP